MSVTPARFSTTTSLALMSRHNWAARCTRCAPSRAVIEGRDVAMRFSEGSSSAHRAESLYVAYLVCESSVRGLFRISHANGHTRKDLTALDSAARSAVAEPPTA